MDEANFHVTGTLLVRSYVHELTEDVISCLMILYDSRFGQVCFQRSKHEEPHNEEKHYLQLEKMGLAKVTYRVSNYIPTDVLYQATEEGEIFWKEHRYEMTELLNKLHERRKTVNA